MQIGIIGLPSSSKTTVFDALTGANVDTQPFSSGRFEIHTAVVDVPDARVDRLAEMFHPRKVTRAQVQYNDIAGLEAGAGQSGGFSGPLLNAIAANDALLYVVRAFQDESVPHVNGSVDPARDVRSLDAELILSDLGIVERRMERLQGDLKKNPAIAEPAKIEYELMKRLRAALEFETPLRDVDLSQQEMLAIKSFAFLSIKPVLIVLNVGDEGSINPADYVSYDHRNSAIITIRGSLEREISQLDTGEAVQFMQEFDIAERSLPRLIRLSYELLGLQSFFTVGEDEVRAWTVRRGGTSIDAAAAIHTDLARGFICAEVVGYDDLLAAGSLAEAKKRGTLRLQGRDYVLADGDIVNIRFNV